MLRGSDDIMAACKARGMAKGHTTPDGLFTLTEVECMGNCANAPMVQINDDNYEDLTADSMDAVLEALARAKRPRPERRSRPPHELPRRRADDAEGNGRPTTITGGNGVIADDHGRLAIW
jgi:(2Fe-2S) ferredoxin